MWPSSKWRSWSGRSYRKLTRDGEMLVPVGERTANPRLKGGLFVGDETAPGQPGAIKPVKRARLELDAAAQRYLGHAHRGKLEAADFAHGLDVVDYDRDVVPTVL